MTDTEKMTSGDRRELRSILKKQFQVLRNDIKRRREELHGEIETQLLRRYREQDDAIKDAEEAMRKAHADYRIACETIADDLRLRRPELTVELNEYRGGSLQMNASDPQRYQEHRALLSAIPQQVADASTVLEQTELDLLRELTIGAITSDEAIAFMNRIPTVGALVPTARLNALEAGK